MNKLYRVLLASAAIATLAGCSKYDEIEDTPESGQGKTIKFYADVEGQENTRASITVDGSTFSGTWEANDDMGILATIPGGTSSEKSEKFAYSTASSSFEGAPAWINATSGAWKYYAFAPHVDVAKGITKVSIPFGNARTQDGNKFNSKFDALVAKPREITNAAPGMDDAGKAIAFNLNRLTSILRFTAAGSKADKVKALLLTSENEATQPISAASLDFDAAQGASTTATLSTTDASNVIAMTYSANAPAANGVEAFFNVPSGTYDKLTLEVITEDKQIGSVSVVRSTKPFMAGTLYTKAIADMTFAPIAAPSLIWPGHADLSEVNYITTMKDEQGNKILDYPAAIDIVVPGGIAGLTVNITSDVLNNLVGISSLNLFKDKLLSEAFPIEYSALGLFCSTEIQYKKSTIFDIRKLVPMIEDLSAAPGSQHIFEVVITDLAGQVTTQALTFEIPSPIIYNDDADLWKNTASFTINKQYAAQSVSVDYRIKGETQWNAATVVAEADGSRTATISPTWTEGTNDAGLKIHTVDSKTGIFAKNTYEYQLTVDGTVIKSGELTPASNNGDTIPDGNMENSSLSCFGLSNATTTFWGSGNNDYMSAFTGGVLKNLCTQKSKSGSYSACLASQYAFMLAAGNLFSGTFVKPSTQGTVGFGKNYNWTARPTRLRFKYHASIGGGTFRTKWKDETGNFPVTSAANDAARIFVAIVDWDKTQDVSSGLAAPSGMWDPVKASSTGAGAIIGYGSLWINSSTTGDDLVSIDLPLYYYDKITKPSKAYKIVISCSSNAYGDYMCGCDKNVLYVDDFQWVY